MMNWLKKKLTILALAMSNVERNALSQTGDVLSDDTQQVQRHRQGMLSDDLMQGRVTEEVKMLRHRMYKILDESSKIKVNFSKDSSGNLTYEMVDRTVVPAKLKGDPFDDYKIELVMDNSDISAGADLTSLHPDEAIVEKQIICGRNGVNPSFELEQYTSKLFVRYIEDDLRLLEFYIPKYRDGYDRKTIFLISKLKQILESPWRYSDILDIKTVGFITFNAIGSQDFREFTYTIDKFDKIVEHNGSYIIKFKANVITNGDNVVDKYKHDLLEEKYANKEARNNK
jgi:hypothetical protein